MEIDTMIITNWINKDNSVTVVFREWVGGKGTCLKKYYYDAVGIKHLEDIQGRLG